jgi:hypothetical protein
VSRRLDDHSDAVQITRDRSIQLGAERGRQARAAAGVLEFRKAEATLVREFVGGPVAPASDDAQQAGGRVLRNPTLARRFIGSRFIRDRMRIGGNAAGGGGVQNPNLGRLFTDRRFIPACIDDEVARGKVLRTPNLGRLFTDRRFIPACIDDEAAGGRVLRIPTLGRRFTEGGFIRFTRGRVVDGKVDGKVDGEVDGRQWVPRREPSKRLSKARLVACARAKNNGRRSW